MTKIINNKNQFRLTSQNDIRTTIKSLPSPVSVIEKIFDPSVESATKLSYLNKLQKNSELNALKSGSICDIEKTLHYTGYCEFIARLHSLVKFYLSVPIITLEIIEKACSNEEIHKTVMQNIKRWTDAQIEIVEILSLCDKDCAKEYLHLSIDNLIKAIKSLSTEIKKFNYNQNQNIASKLISMHMEIKTKFKEAETFLKKNCNVALTPKNKLIFL